MFFQKSIFRFFIVFVFVFVFGVVIGYLVAISRVDYPCICQPCFFGRFCKRCGHYAQECPRIKKQIEVLQNVQSITNDFRRLISR